MFMEIVVSQQLVSAGHNLFYFAHYDTEMRRCDMVADFLIERGKKISPIEVESGRSIAHGSLERFTKTFADELGTSYILCNRDVSEGLCHPAGLYGPAAARREPMLSFT